MTKAAKRANRDEGMEAFAKYYREGFAGVKLSTLKKLTEHPPNI